MPPRGGRGGSRQAAQGDDAGESSTAPSTGFPNTSEANPSQVGSSQLGSVPPVSVSSRGAAAAGSSRTGSKFRPRGNRRSEAERERIAQEQEKIQSKKLADDARQQSRGRVRRAGRSRGGFRGRGGNFSTANGPLADGMAQSHGFGSRTGAGGTGSQGNFRAKLMAHRGADNKYGFADGIEDDNRINADELRPEMNASDEDEHDGGKITATARKKRTILPIGIRREEYQAPAVVVATAEDIEVEEKGLVKREGSAVSEDMWVGEEGDGSGAALQDDNEVWSHAAPKTRGKVKIKNEEGQEIETTDISEIAAHEQNREARAMEIDGTAAHERSEVPPSPEAKKAGKRRVVPRDPEEAVTARDCERLLNLLSLETDEAEKLAALEGNVFLFQFPPVLPPLKRKAKPAAPQSAVKDEPEDDDVVMLDQPSRDAAPANIDLTAEDADNKVKVEEDAADEQSAGGSNMPNLYEEGGYVGELVVRKSGKATLNWGGQILEMGMGAPTQFLSTVVLLEENDVKAKSDEIAGTAYGMGRIEANFVLAPRFSDVEEWVVNPEDLVPDEADASNNNRAV